VEAIVTEKQVSIYALIDPVSGEVRYIGKANDAQKRLKGHLREARHKTPVYFWIGSLRKKGLVPELKVIATCEHSEWEEAERKAIAEGRSKGMRLLNVVDGGDEPYCPTHVRRENGKKAAKTRVNTPQKARIYRIKRELGSLLKRGYVSEETKAKLRYAAWKRPDLFGEYLSL